MKSLKTITIIVLVFFTSHLSFAQKSKLEPEFFGIKKKHTESTCVR